MSQFQLRLNHNAETDEEILHYASIRAKQLMHEGYSLTQVRGIPEGMLFYWRREYSESWGIAREDVPVEYMSIYLKPQYRGKGLYKVVYARHNSREKKYPILTVNDCKLVEYLKKTEDPFCAGQSIPFVCAGRAILDSPEYKAIESHYGDNKAKRSGQFKMNHIDEGISLIFQHGKSFPGHRITKGPEKMLLQAALAYCLHPILQADEALVDAMEKYTIVDVFKHGFVSQQSLVLAMEYRAVANAYLSPRDIKSTADIALSPLLEVEEMLIADKVQNRKDFEAYHEGKHPKSDRLKAYFHNWLARLEISEEAYQEHVKMLRRNDVFFKFKTGEDLGK